MSIENTTFFDSLELVDVERVHSAVIKWILSNECHALSPSAKVTILMELFSEQDGNKNRQIVNAQTEWQNMDIVIQTIDSQNISETWVIENKIKCDLHDNQLEKYTKIILSGNDIFCVKDAKYAHFAYLTLMDIADETVKYNGAAYIWRNISYGSLIRIIKSNICKIGLSLDRKIVLSYLSALSNMVCQANLAIKEPEMLFDQRIEKPVKVDWAYIEKLKLRNILQRYYFNKIKNDILDDFNKNVNLSKGFASIRVSPAANGGEAVLVIDILDCFKKIPDLKDAIIGIQLQHGTYKVDITLQYDNLPNIKKNIAILTKYGLLGEESNDSWVFPLVLKKHSLWKLDFPKTRARMSMSKKEKKMDWSKEAISKKFVECYSICKDIIASFQLYNPQVTL